MCLFFLIAVNELSMAETGMSANFTPISSNASIPDACDRGGSGNASSTMVSYVFIFIIMIKMPDFSLVKFMTMSCLLFYVCFYFFLGRWSFCMGQKHPRPHSGILLLRLPGISDSRRNVSREVWRKVDPRWFSIRLYRGHPSDSSCRQD